jgi:organic hydroperoxide reductase OsmC/OhrA
MALRLSESAAREQPGVTDPTELFAAAHARAVAVILARTLDSNRTPAHELVVKAACEYAGAWYEVKAIEFSVRGRIPNIDARQFEEATYTLVELTADRSVWTRRGQSRSRRAHMSAEGRDRGRHRP